VFSARLLVLFFYVLYRSALEKKKAEENKDYQAIDYDAPIESDKSTIGFGTRVSICFMDFLMFLVLINLQIICLSEFSQ
jgi:hypothetical protein